MWRLLSLTALLSAALAEPLGYGYVPPPPPPPPGTYIPPQRGVEVSASRPVQQQLLQPVVPPLQPVVQQLQVPSSPAPRPRPLPAAGSTAPARFTQFNYKQDIALNRNPGTGGSGPMGVFVGACSASMVCVPEAMCNPYTGFVRGGLLREPTGPSGQPTVALLRCYRLKDGGVGDGVCCRMPHINDPWPDQQRAGST
ncbi:hypothetical protein FJT64_002605 [Amphibalanus amphitrite]|uniref:Inactive serine protease scarface clip-domain domain-containing protein n=1 Tax=Amphibalanus amphitrite TaxID=1232801 RepID=A0A6A4WC84_AMPAM|nr:hypothetical protein FJT64_002605 [Amphibalanus amphitrite]